MKRLSQFCIAAAAVGLVAVVSWRSVRKLEVPIKVASMDTGHALAHKETAPTSQRQPGVQGKAVVLKPVQSPKPVSMLAFDQWADKYMSAAPAEKSALLTDGVSLAKARQEEMLKLIQENPEAAYKNAISYEVRKAMPQEVAGLMEKQISAEGKLTPLFYVPLPGHESEVPPTEFRAEINGQKYLAFPFGAYKRFTLPQEVPMQGVALGNKLALSSEPMREVSAAEREDLLKDPSNNLDASLPIVAVFGSKPKAFASKAKLTSVSKALQQSITSPARFKALPPSGFGTQGRKELLLIPVKFADDPRPPISQDAAETALRANNQYFVDGSYGTASFFSTVTPPMTLPQRKVYYAEFLDTQLFSDALAAAAAAGYDPGQYGYIYVMFNPIPGVNFGGRSDGLLNGSIGSITHELGHNFGLGHANYWDVSGTTPGPTNNLPVDRDSEVGHSDVNAPFRLGMVSKKVPIEEYGNIYEVMGSGGGHFSAWAKWTMNWLPDQFVHRVRTCETNRIYAFDTPHIQQGRLYALRVHKDYSTDFTGVPNGDASETDRSYWISHREGYDNNPFMEQGIEVIWDSMLLDTTYETSPGKNDSAVVIGRTFADQAAGVFITPVAKGGGPAEGDKWVDVVVNFGPFVTNQPPTLTLTASSLNVAPGTAVDFTADATDPNGDALAYNWDFGDTSFGFNSPTNRKTFSAAGQYVVRCDVSDMKGGVVSRYVVVTVGTPDTFTISGRVVDTDGNPVRGARVHNGGTLPPYTPPPEPGMPANPPAAGNATYRYAFTDSDGYYTIGNVPAGTFEMGTFVFGYITRPVGFYNPVVVSDANISDLNFIAQNLPVVTVTPGADATENDASNPGYLTISRSGDLSQELKVRFAINGRALMGTDYSELIEAYTTNVVKMTNDDVITTNFIPVLNKIGQVTIAPFESSTNIYILPIDNDAYAGPRDVLFTLMLQTNDLRYSTIFTNVVSTNTVGTNTIVTTNTELLTITNKVGIPGWELLPSGPDNTLTWFQVPPTYAISNGEASILIIEDEPAGKPTVFAYATDIVATEGGDDTAMVTFIRDGGPLDVPLVVHYSVSGTASNGFDFQPLSGTITIQPGDEYAALPIIAINDLFVEGTETVDISVLEDAAYDSSPDPASVFIVDDDLPQVYVYATDSVADHRGNNGSITVARSGDLSSDLLVNYLVSGTAVAGVDYNILAGSLTIPANQISANITISALTNAPPGERYVTILLSESPAYNIHNLNTATVTIQDTLPTVTLDTTAAATAEGGAPGVFTVTRTGDTSSSLNVYFAVGGSAVEGSDYVAIGTNVVIPAGSATVTIAVVPKEDKFNELRGISGQDNVIVQLVPGPGYNLGGRTGGTVTITDNDGADLPSVGFMLPSSSGREDSGLAAIWLRTTSNPPTNKPVRVAYRITSGTAVPNINYTPFGTGYVEILHWDPPKPADPLHTTEGGLNEIDIPLLNDNLAAGNKTFTIQLFNYVGLITNYTFITNGTVISSNTIITPYPTNYYIGAYSSHTFTILDVGQAVVDIKATAPVATEQGPTVGAFEITRTGGSFSNPLTVRLAITGNAANGSDYVKIPDSVTIPAGTNRVVVPVIPIDDPQEEYIEYVTISLLNTPGLTVQGQGDTVFIFDNDGTIQFTRQTYEVDESGTNIVIGVVRSGNTNLALTVDYQVRNGTASNGLDYAAITNGTLAFAPGELEKTFTINILNDSLVEGNETVSLVLTNPTGGVPLGGQRAATLVILDDDTLFQFHTNAFFANENGTNAAIVVDRLGLINATSRVDLVTTNGTATDGVDYVGTNVTLVFAPGETNKVILLPIKDDALFEGNETVQLALINPGTNTAVGSVSNSVLTIVDDECTVAFASTNFSAFEYAGVVSVEVRRIGGTVNPFSIGYFTTDGTANGTTTNNQDYVGQAGTLAFAGDSFVALTNGSGVLVFQPGETNKFINITLLDDVLGEGNENFFVTLTNLTLPSVGVFTNSIVLGQTRNTTVTIVDNETAGNVDYEYSSGSGANGPVYALGLQSDGKVVFAGDFTTFNGFSFRRVARLTPEGFLDSSFNPGSGVNGLVRTLAIQPDGKIIVAGLFTNVDSTIRTNIARLNANGNVDVTFNAGAGPNGLVRAAIAQADGKIIIGGEFTSVNGAGRARLARLNTDGSVDGSFNPSADGAVYALALQPDGKLVVGGAFANIASSQQNGIARLNATGTLDGTFSAGSGASGLVRSVAVQTNGMILLGGDFVTINGVSAPHLARLTANGAVDDSFNAGFGPDGSVYAVAVHSGGKIVIGGNFPSVNGFPRSNFARLRANGNIDFTFNITSGANSNVNAVVVQPNSAIVIGGEFTAVNGLTRNRIARLHGDERFVPTTVEFGSLAFNAFEDSGAALINVVRSGNTNTAFTVQFGTTDGTARAGLDYTATNGTISFAVGETVKSFSVPLINDGLFELDETVNLFLTNAPVIVDIGLPALLVIKDDEKSVQFSSTNFFVVEHGTNGLVTVVRSGQLTGEVSVACFTADGTATAPADYIATSNLLVFPANVATQTFVVPILDDFRKESNETIVVTLANSTGGTAIGNFFQATLTIVDDDFGPGSPDATFDPGMGANSLVRAMAVQADGKVIIGGAFTNVGGLDRRYVARLGTNGAVDASFNPGVGPNALVSAVATNSNGRVLVGGNFSLIGASSRNRFAQLQADGSLEPSFSGSNGINAAIFTILPQPNNRGLVGGAFSVPFNKLGRLRSDGTPDSTFFAGTGPNGTVYSAAAQTNGQIIIGGDFTAVNSISRYRVARVDADGTLDLSFQPPVIVTGAVFSVAMQPDGKVVIGGDFTLVNGTNRSRIARLNQDGSLDTSFNPGSGANAIVYAVASQPDGKVLLGGDFTTINGTNRNRIARLNQDGTLDRSFEPGTGPNNTVFTLSPLPDGKVLIGGTFTSVNGLARAGVARLSGDDPIDVTIQKNSIYLNGQFTIFFSSQAGQAYVVEGSTDFVGWTTLGSVTAASPISSFTDVNAGAFGLRFYRVRQLTP